MNKKPYDRLKDYTFSLPPIVRTSNVLVTDRNLALLGEFFSDLMKRNSVHEVLCFVRKETVNGEVKRESQKVSASTFGLLCGGTFKYVHTIGVSERVIINEYVDGVHVESVYTISG